MWYNLHLDKSDHGTQYQKMKSIDNHTKFNIEQAHTA